VYRSDVPAQWIARRRRLHLCADALVKALLSGRPVICHTMPPRYRPKDRLNDCFARKQVVPTSSRSGQSRAEPQGVTSGPQSESEVQCVLQCLCAICGDPPRSPDTAPRKPYEPDGTYSVSRYRQCSRGCTLRRSQRKRSSPAEAKPPV
jgi:hypothetical protein